LTEAKQETLYRKWINRIAPTGSARRRAVQSGREAAATWRQEGFLALLRKTYRGARRSLRQLRKPRGLFAQQYTLEDNSTVFLYTDNPDLFPDYQPRKPFPAERSQAPVSLILTCYNEAGSVLDWFEHLKRQTRLPQEVVVVDGGSADGTLELLQRCAAESPVPFRVLSEPGANIARGRNIAIAEARHPIIACTDFGCRPRPAWLERITAPFDAGDEIQVSGGWFVALQKGKPIRRLGWAVLHEVDPQEFLPSSRSLAFLKTAWESAGGYPEWLTLTGEDTYFAAELKRVCQHWAFVPQAVVEWIAPATPPEYWQKIYNWSIGDGESGAFTQWYWWSLVRLISVLILSLPVILVAVLAWLLALITLPLALILALAALVGSFFVVYSGMYRMLKDREDLVWEMGAEFSRLAGFLRGARNRRQVTLRRFRQVPGIFFILAVVPIDDTGGGARSTQIALELLRRGYLVVYIHKFPKYESVELDLVIRHPNLISSPLERFLWDKFSQDFGDILERKPLAALTELPMKEFLPVLQSIRTSGGVVAYDLLDDWKTSLGGEWYSQEAERAVIEESQLLLATAPALVERLQKISMRQVTLLPNAVNSYLFNPHRHYPVPLDWPEADFHLIYIGALWGEWFDWELLRDIASSYPQAAVVIIGDYVGQCPDPPENLHFLGLKAQRTLPAYLAHSDVAIIPWKINEITRATSPLKVYEYIAMHKPVIAPELPTLRDIPAVHLAQDQQAFIEQIAALRSASVPAKQIERFVQRNDWKARVDVLLEQVQTNRQISSARDDPKNRHVTEITP
jgi:glycosyltransferase involved in cell wall biosynthesis